MQKKISHILPLPFKGLFKLDYTTNILSLKDVVNTFHITIDASKESKMIVHTGNDSVMKYR